MDRPTPAFSLSWTHHICLLGISDRDEHSFYEIESAQSGWTVREIKRQIAACLYERLALSRNKKRIRELATHGQVVTRPEDLFKEPYVLEFLGLEEQANYSETDLEHAIISRAERFLLELGKGFLFEARQRRFTFDDDHDFVDLVFYNRLLRCYVLIDLKLGKLSHQDLGQMQMYVNHFDRTVGIDHDTARFATEAIHRGWKKMGMKRHGGAKKLLIMADGGGSNGHRSRLWKVSIQDLANRLDMSIQVCHFPPGTSKWNKIERRMFCHITQNWRGRPLISHEVIVNLIANTKTERGLKVRAGLDTGKYPIGVKVTKEELAVVRLKPESFHGDWNYAITPERRGK